MSLEPFLTNLSFAQSKAKFTPEVQTASEPVNADLLKAIVEAVLAGGDDASAEGEQGKALKAGFEFAAALVKMLEREPSTDEKLTLYAYFKQGHGQKVEKPGMFALEAKYKYNAWEKISHISAARAQALYIQEVSKLIEQIGTRDA
ncbi:ACBP-domain-containing protein [Aspergillus taichungensis]|uniref:ACBP-domain-containing protein n=1 Tax=Aspergillus taichungensis TaxID=482145 RepID=A0A2J5HKS6_9EURO|nr:ACBP-domain-containing protein [Aspergillus taichungensis]